MPWTAVDPARPPLQSTRRLLLTGLLTGLVAALLTITGPTAAAAATGLSSASAAPARVLAQTTRAERIDHAFRVARRQIGDAYRYGAEGPRRFDCSGLVYFATHRAGLTAVPRTSSEQGDYVRHIRRTALQRGDLVFFTGRSGVYHVGFYAGRRDGRRIIIHAPSTGERVSRSPIWTDGWFAGTLRR